MAPPGVESNILRDILKKDLDEAVGYDSYNGFVGTMSPLLPPSLKRDDNNFTPIAFLERGAADTLTALRTSPDLASTAEVNTNPIDEQQQQLFASEERARRLSKTMSRLAG